MLLKKKVISTLSNADVSTLGLPGGLLLVTLRYITVFTVNCLTVNNAFWGSKVLPPPLFWQTFELHK